MTAHEVLVATVERQLRLSTYMTAMVNTRFGASPTPGTWAHGRRVARRAPRYAPAGTSPPPELTSLRGSGDQTARADPTQPLRACGGLARIPAARSTTCTPVRRMQ